MATAPTWMMLFLIGVPFVVVILWYLFRGLFSRDDDSK
jgi:hypothetical protein